MSENKYLDENGLILLASIINGELKDKVDKVEGKGLSTNDFTNEMKTKLENAGDSSFNGDYSSLTNKPTKLSQFENDEGYQTAAQVNNTINSKISSVMTYKASVSSMSDLPTNASIGDVYNIETAGPNNKAGDNAVWNGTAWDVLSGTVNMTNYWSKTELRAITNDEITALFTEE